MTSNDNEKPVEPAEINDAAPEAEPEVRFGIPKKIRILGGGQIGVDDENDLGMLIPTGSAYYSEEHVQKLLGWASEEAEAAAHDTAEADAYDPETGHKYFGHQHFGYREEHAWSRHEYLEAMRSLSPQKAKVLAAIALEFLGSDEALHAMATAGVYAVLTIKDGDHE